MIRLIDVYKAFGPKRVLGTGQRDQMVLGDPGAPAPPAGLAIELEEQCLLGQVLDGGGGRRRPRGSSEVRVDDHAGGIDHR